MHAQACMADSVVSSAKTLKGDEKCNFLEAYSKKMSGCPAEKQALIWHQLGVAWHKKNAGKAIAYTQKALQIRKKVLPKSSPDIAQSYSNLGVYYRQEGLYTQAINYLDTAANLRKANNDKKLSDSWFDLAKAYKESGDYIKANDYITLALKSAQTDLDSAKYLMTRGNNLQWLNRNEEAITTLLASAHIFKQHEEESINLAKCYLNIGNVYENLKQYPDALNWYGKSAKIAQLEDVDLDIQSNMNIGFLLHQTKQFEQASKILLYCLDVYDENYGTADPDMLLANIYANLGDNQFLQKNYPTAAVWYEKALNAFPLPSDSKLEQLAKEQQLGSITGKGFLFAHINDYALCLKRLYTSSNDPSFLQRSQKYYLLGDQVLEHMRRDIFADESKFFWREKTKRFYDEAFDLAWLAKDLDLACRLMEHSKSVLLLDDIKKAQGTNLLPKAELEQEIPLRLRITALENKRNNGSLSETETTELADLKKNYDALIQRWEKQFPAYRVIVRDTSFANIQQIKAQLAQQKAKSLFVNFAYADSAVYRLHVDAQGAHFEKINWPDRDSLFAEFYQRISNPASFWNKTGLSQFNTINRLVYSLLFKNIQTDNYQKLIVCSDDLRVPFESLITNAELNAPRYLVEAMSVAYVYSASAWLRSLQSVAQASNAKILMMSPEDFKKHKLPDLKLSSNTGTSVMSFWSGDWFKGPDARVSNFVEQAPKAGIIQLFTHASAAGEPKLFFADSALYLSDLKAIEGYWNTQLLILSACETGVGAYKPGEGVMSLARGFARFGIPAIVTTLYPVNEAATMEISIKFHEFLADGMDKDVALQQAKLHYIKTHEGEAQASPSYWAGMVLIGQDLPIQRGTNPLWYWGIGLAVAAGLGFLAWRFKR
jgi:CHAT domain-containing protein